MSEFCNDYGDPDVPECLKVPDPKYTMDLMPAGVIHWCSVCGPRAHGMAKLIEKHIMTHGTVGLESAVTEAEKERKLS